IGGALQSAAYLGVVLKIPYEEAATATAKFKKALGIADEELLPFIDDIQRLSHMGVQVGEMSFAFSKIGATMKGLGMTGLKAARDVEPLIGMLIKSGFSGETVGTNLGNIIKSAVSYEGNKDLDALGIKLNFTDASGNFKGTANMIKELEKLKAIKSDTARLNIIESIFGKGEASEMANVLIQNGTSGLQAFNKKMQEQADLNTRVANSSKTLGNMWEAFQGTMSNLFAIMGESVAPGLKSMTGWLNNATSSISDFSKEHPILTQGLSWIVVGLTAVTFAAGSTLIAVSVLGRSFAMIKMAALMSGSAIGFLGGVIVSVLGRSFAMTKALFLTTAGEATLLSKAILFVGGAVKTVGLFLLTNPIGLAITGIATAAFLIYKYWGPIKAFFADMINSIGSWFNNLFAWFDKKIQTVGSTIQKVKSFFGGNDAAPIQRTPNPRVAAVRGVAQKAGTSNTVNVNITNPNFTSKEHAAATQKQIDEQVRKAMARLANDKKDRSYS
ncbi:MAG: phage tail tape measure protein, partial [Campylobacterota bacterium]